LSYVTITTEDGYATLQGLRDGAILLRTTHHKNLTLSPLVAVKDKYRKAVPDQVEDDNAGEAAFKEGTQYRRVMEFGKIFFIKN
jgi:hypothetical protein